MGLVGFWATCWSFLYLVGLAHLSAIVYPYLGCTVHSLFYAFYCCVYVLLSLISMLGGIIDGCPLSALIVNAIVIGANSAIVYCLTKVDPNLATKLKGCYEACKCWGNTAQ